MVWPLPSWPWALPPQQRTVVSDITAQVESPAATSLVGVGAGLAAASTGGGASSMGGAA